MPDRMQRELEIDLPADLYAKMTDFAAKNNRTVEEQLVYSIQQFVEAYEETYGKILLPSDGSFPR